jgi:hypothetical protein
MLRRNMIAGLLACHLSAESEARVRFTASFTDLATILSISRATIYSTPVVRNALFVWLAKLRFSALPLLDSAPLYAAARITPCVASRAASFLRA